MVTAEMSIREMLLLGKDIEKYDYIRLKNRKQKQCKGVFVSQKHIKMLEENLLPKLEEEQQKQMDLVMSFAGMASGLFGNKTIQEIKSEMKI